MFRVLADFNEVRDDSVRGLAADIRSAAGRSIDSMAVGDRVLVHDGGGEEALGVVDRFTDTLVFVTVDWDTFGPSGRYVYGDGIWSWRSSAAMVQAGQPMLAHIESVDIVADDSFRVPVPA